jgi:uncharacterized protein involved in exopolysaccharide biosynthesis
MEKNTRKISFQKQESLFVKMISRYLAYWPVFLIFLAISSGIGYAYLLYTSPKFEATASIIIKDEKKGNDDSKMMESLNMINSKKIIENEVEVLQSRKIVNNVVNKLKLYAPIFQEDKYNHKSAYQQSPLVIEAYNPNIISKKDEKIGGVKIFYQDPTRNSKCLRFTWYFIKFLRLVYITVIFYFLPFVFTFLAFIYTLPKIDSQNISK